MSRIADPTTARAGRGAERVLAVRRAVSKIDLAELREKILVGDLQPLAEELPEARADERQASHLILELGNLSSSISGCPSGGAGFCRGLTQEALL